MTPVVLVTGASGAIGGRLLSALRDAGWRTRALVHRATVEDADELVHGDLLDPSSLVPSVAGVDAVVHLAAVTHARSSRRYFSVNRDGTRHLVDAAVRAGAARFVFVSTRAIGWDGGAYSRSKREAEALVSAACGQRSTIVRLPEVFGAGGREGVDRIIHAARAGAPVVLAGDGKDTICPVCIDDVLSPLIAALGSPAAAGRTYTLAGGCVSLADFARTCRTVYARDGRTVGVPLPLVGLACRLSRFLPLPVYPDQLARLRAPKPEASPEARADLGFAPRPLEDALRMVR